ncbi:hypothetical protein JTE90_019589 [Oedothorax gibbosus]|uniref:Uncharacterized protein n=1 Tax=Oedothorax gibbosus TaxID=931172 RepID=A0AAV6V6I9_9ARAC|nr:hypothetical protein JTE90_019589 [Oedothorax gibbosus]
MLKVRAQNFDANVLSVIARTWRKANYPIPTLSSVREAKVKNDFNNIKFEGNLEEELYNTFRVHVAKMRAEIYMEVY